MSDSSPRLALPFLQPAQAQKHVTHNEALQILDIATQLSVIAFDATTPPTTALPGAVYALGAAPQDAWAGQAGALALWWQEGWQFFEPREGWRAALAGTAQVFVRQGGAWIAQQIDSAAQLGVNTTADTTNRLSVKSDQTLLSHDGAGHRLTLNKADISESAEIVFQSNWSGRAVLALDTGDALKLKLSPDGATWGDAMTWDPATGHVGMGVSTPARPVHISEALRLEPGTAPAAPAAGDLYFDAASAKLRCHDGTGWQDLF